MTGELACVGGFDLTEPAGAPVSRSSTTARLRLSEHAGQVLGDCGELQRSEVAAQLLVEAGLGASHRRGRRHGQESVM